MESELRWRSFEGLLDNVAANAHPVTLNAGTGAGVDLAGIRIDDIHADLFQHLQGLPVNHFDLVVGDDA